MPLNQYHFKILIYNNETQQPYIFLISMYQVMNFLTVLGVTEILFSLRLVAEGKTGKKIPESSRLQFQKKFLAETFPLSDAEDNTSRSLNRGGIADLPLLRTLFWRRGVVVITTAQLHSTKSELRFCAGSNPDRSVSEIHDGEDL